MNASSTLARCAEHDQLEPCSVCMQDRQQVSSGKKQHIPSEARIPFSDRDLALAVRAALLGIVDAIERRYELKPKKKRD